MVYFYCQTGPSNSTAADNVSNKVATVTGDTSASLQNVMWTSSDCYFLINYSQLLTASSLTSDIPSSAISLATSVDPDFANTSVFGQWIRLRTPPPNNVMPSANFGNVGQLVSGTVQTTPGPAYTKK